MERGVDEPFIHLTGDADDLSDNLRQELAAKYTSETTHRPANSSCSRSRSTSSQRPLTRS